MSESRPAFLPIFRSEHQAAVIGAIFSQPDRVWTGPELVEATGASQPTVSREVASLAEAGLVVTPTVDLSGGLHLHRIYTTPGQ